MTRIVCAILLLCTCASAGAGKAGLPPIEKGKTWRLVWQDEFKGKKVDESKWELIGDSPRRDGFWVKEDAYLDGKGHLILRTKKDGDRFTCGAVRTRGKFRAPFRLLGSALQVPETAGHWPAFWLFPTVGVPIQARKAARDGNPTSWKSVAIEQDSACPALERLRRASQVRGPRSEPGRFQQRVPHFRSLVEAGRVRFSTWTARKRGGPPRAAVCQVPVYTKLTEEIGTWGRQDRRGQAARRIRRRLCPRV